MKELRFLLGLLSKLEKRLERIQERVLRMLEKERQQYMIAEARYQKQHDELTRASLQAGNVRRNINKIIEA